MSAATSASTATSSIKIVNGFPIPDFSDEPNKPQPNKNEKVCPPAPRKPRPTSFPNLKSKRPRALSFN